MKAFIFLASVLTALPLSAKSITDTTQVFHLGEVTVFEHQRNFKVNQVNSDFMKSADIQRVSEALNWVPGLIMQEVGGRSEAGFMLRGFSSNDVPIYIDGVPLTAPYDGTVDLYRLSAGMLSKIDVSKSASSLLLGGNTMGPSINLISRQPQKLLEIHFDVNTLWHSNLNVGGRWNKWFAQLDLSYANVGNFRLPHSYPTDSKYLDGHKRLNSKTRDFDLNTKVGYVPNATDEYVVGYTLVRAKKHIPPYLGENGKVQFRIYPDWDKDELYFHSTTRVAPKLTLKSRLWYDTFKNTLDSYDDFTYSTQEGKQGWTSIYDDYALGANVNLVWATTDNNDLKFGGNYKYDVHRSHNVGEPTAKISEGIYSFVVEDEAKLNPQMSLTASLGWFARQGYKIEEYNKKTGISEMPNSHDGNINALAAFDYHPSANQHFRFSLSTASLFARLKDRYSYKLGKTIPNPDLGTENAINLDLAYEGRWNNLTWQAGAFYNFINDIENLKYSTNTWNALLDIQCHYDTAPANPILASKGNDTGLPTITVIGNPYCRPCAEIHRRVSKLREYGFLIMYIFTAFSQSLLSANDRILGACNDKSVDETWGIISQWYESFLSEDISHSSLQNMEKKELLSARKSSIRQMSWVKNNHINGTPTLLVDGRNIPTGYELEDLMLIY